MKNASCITFDPVHATLKKKQMFSRASSFPSAPRMNMRQGAKGVVSDELKVFLITP